MTTLQVSTAGTGVVRDAHYVTPTGASTPVRTLLLEPQRTNLCIRSEEFDTWTNNGSCTVVADVAVAPDGTATADRLEPTSTASARSRTVTFTGDGVKCASVYLKSGTSTRSAVRIHDTTAAVTRHRVSVGWSAGVPTVTSAAGSGTVYPVVDMGNGWYRVMFSADGVVAANTNEIRVFPDDLVAAGTVLAWGAQAENAVVPSSYIPTAATTVTRNEDSLYWDIPALVPREMTVYARHIQAEGFDFNVRRVWHIGENAAAGARLFLETRTVPAYRVNHDNGTTNVQSQVTTIPALSDIVEHRSVLGGGGEVTMAQSINAATEVVGVTSSGNTLAGAWAGARLWLGRAANGGNNQVQFTHIAIALGTKTRAEMRAIAGVP
jgi:hypothetical protein